MVHNYLSFALRNLIRHKLYSFINIAGLTVGLTCAIFIILFVRDQLSYDRWIPGTENLYRLEVSVNLPGKPLRQSARIPFAATQTMIDQIPEVQARTRIIRKSVTILVGDRQFPQTVDAVDPNFLQVIRLPLVAGAPAPSLPSRSPRCSPKPQRKSILEINRRPERRIVLSRQRCDATYQNCAMQQQSLVVTGVLRDLPHNTQLKADVMIPNTSAASPVTQEYTKAGYGSTAGAMSSWLPAPIRTLSWQNLKPPLITRSIP